MNSPETVLVYAVFPGMRATGLRVEASCRYVALNFPGGCLVTVS